MSLARLWRDQGKRDEASNLLATVYRWFTEGFDTRDLKEAKVCSMSWQLESIMPPAPLPCAYHQTGARVGRDRSDCRSMRPHGSAR
jgi:hypothetical protein